MGNGYVGCHRWAWKSRGGWVGSAAPLGLGFHNPGPPTADAVGYCLTVHRTCASLGSTTWDSRQQATRGTFQIWDG